jgi:hypothetical protein
MAIACRIADRAWQQAHRVGARRVMLIHHAEFAASDDMPMPLRDRRQKYVPNWVDVTAECEWRLSM